MENNGSRSPGPPDAGETHPADSYVFAQGMFASITPALVRLNGIGFAFVRSSEVDPPTMLTRVIFDEASQQSNAP